MKRFSIQKITRKYRISGVDCQFIVGFFIDDVPGEFDKDENGIEKREVVRPFSGDRAREGVLQRGTESWLNASSTLTITQRRRFTPG
jgi:hypothetical protein